MTVLNSHTPLGLFLKAFIVLISFIHMKSAKKRELEKCVQTLATFSPTHTYWCKMHVNVGLSFSECYRKDQ